MHSHTEHYGSGGGCSGSNGICLFFNNQALFFKTNSGFRISEKACPRNDGHFKRFGTQPNQHGIEGSHVHQPTRNLNPQNGIITGKPGSRTKYGDVTIPGAKDIKQLYDYLFNGKYRKG